MKNDFTSIEQPIDSIFAATEVYVAELDIRFGQAKHKDVSCGLVELVMTCLETHIR